jgi:hypothetical protein
MIKAIDGFDQPAAQLGYRLTEGYSTAQTAVFRHREATGSNTWENL